MLRRFFHLYCRPVRNSVRSSVRSHGRILGRIQDRIAGRNLRSIAGRNRKRRGLGLFDTMLAVAVLSIMGLAASEVLRYRIDQALMASEAQALFALSGAGREWLLADPVANKPTTNQPVSVSQNTLTTAGVWSSVRGLRTPGRGRTMSLWLWEESDDNILLLARARDRNGIIPSGVPGADDGVVGVGIVRNGIIRGPGISWDTAKLDEIADGFFQEGDLVSVRHVPLKQMANIYLYRRAVIGQPEQNQMETDLDLGEHSITNVGDVQTNQLTVGRIVPNTAYSATSVDVEANLRVEGTVTASGSIDVTGNVDASGVVTLGNINVANQAQLGSAEVLDTANMNTLRTRTSFEAGAVFTNDVVANEVTVEQIHTGGCSGC